MKNCLVLGSGRCGTSLVTGMLNAAGYYCGANLMRAREANPAGFYEDHLVNYANELIMREAVRVSRLHPRLRRLLGRPPHLPGQLWLLELPQPMDWHPPAPATWIMRELVTRTPFAYKDPRFCYTLNAWRPYLEDCLFICMFRHPAVTAASMTKDVASEPYYRNLDIDCEQALGIWRAMYRQVLDAQCMDPGRWLFIDYEQLLSRAALPALSRFLGSELDAGLPDPALNRSQATDAEPGAETLQLYSQLRARARETQPAALATNTRA